MPPIRKLAAIMFTDIVGYTAMMEQDQNTAIASARLHEETLRKIVPEHGGELVQMYGDGSLSHFPSTADAVRCARELQLYLGARDVPLRIGLHVGEIVIETGKIYGDGVNVASRIESSGHAGTILFSKSVYEKIRNDKAFSMEPVGHFRFKNVGHPMEIYALTGDGLDRVQHRLLKNRVSRATTFGFRRSYVITAVIIVALILAFIGRSLLTPSVSGSSIAILPFENLSGDTEEVQWFCEGVIDDIVVQLSKVKDLRVISRATSQQYDRNEKSIRQIAKELHVDYFLEGSVRKIADRAQITAQLINAKGEHVWAEKYDRHFGMDEIFDAQAEVGRLIIEELRVAVSPEQKLRLNRPATPNVDAYQLLLKGRKAADVRTIEGLRKSVAFYRQAIEIDPDYAEAYAEMANSLYMMGTYQLDLMDSVMPEARKLVEKALVINPQLARCFSVLGNIYRTESGTGVSESWQESLSAYRKAIELNPNDATAYLHFSRYYALKPEPEYDKQMELVEKALDLDPLSYVTNKAYIEALLLNKKYKGALDHFNEMKFLFPETNHSQILREIYTAQSKWTKVMEILQNDVQRAPTVQHYYNLGIGYRNFYRNYTDYLKQLELAFDLESPPDAWISREYIRALLLNDRHRDVEDRLHDKVFTSILNAEDIIELQSLLMYYRGDYGDVLAAFNRSGRIPVYMIGYSHARLGHASEARNVIKELDKRNMSAKMKDGLNLPKAYVYAGLGEIDSLRHYISEIEKTGWRNTFWTTSFVFNVHFEREFDPYRDDKWYISFLKRHNFPVAAAD